MTGGATAAGSVPSTGRANLIVRAQRLADPVLAEPDQALAAG
jgi:hypothetical protein